MMTIKTNFFTPILDPEEMWKNIFTQDVLFGNPFRRLVVIGTIIIEMLYRKIIRKRLSLTVLWMQRNKSSHCLFDLIDLAELLDSVYK